MCVFSLSRAYLFDQAVRDIYLKIIKQKKRVISQETNPYEEDNLQDSIIFSADTEKNKNSSLQAMKRDKLHRSKIPGCSGNHDQNSV